MKCMHVRLEFIKTIAVRCLCRTVRWTMLTSLSRKFDMKADLDNTIRSLRNCRAFCLLEPVCIRLGGWLLVWGGKSSQRAHIIYRGQRVFSRPAPLANVLICRRHLFVLASYKSTFPLSLTPRKFKNKPASVSEINIKLGGHVLGWFFSRRCRTCVTFYVFFIATTALEHRWHLTVFMYWFEMCAREFNVPRT